MGSARYRRLTRAAALTVGAGVVAAAAVTARAVVQTRQFRLDRLTVPVLPPGTPPVTVLHISDLHLAPWQHRKIAFVRSLAKLEPDLVIDTGDNFGHADALDALTEALSPLLAFPGLFVLASNDRTAPAFKNPLGYVRRPSRRGHRPARSAPELPVEEFSDMLTAAGWLDVDNVRVDVSVTPSGSREPLRIAAAGLDDAHIDRDQLPPAATAPATSPAAPEPVVTIGVTHAPYTRALNALHGDGVDLIVAGHTHGGQVCLPGYGALVTNCDLDRSRASGLHGWPGQRPGSPGGDESTWLHVSAGLGTSIYAPVRVACPPTATLLTLVARD